MSETITIRQSAMSDFSECRRRWYWAYHRNIVPDHGDRPSPFRKAADVGTLTHLGVQLYYSGKQWGEIKTAMEEWVHNYWLTEHGLDEEAAKGLRLALVMIEGWIEDVAATGADKGESTVWVEKQLEVELPGLWGRGQHTVVVTGKPDRLVLSDAFGYILEDTKSVGQIEDSLQFANQLGRYAVLIRIDDGTVVSRVRSQQIKKVLRTKGGPFFGRPFLQWNQERYDAAWGHMRVEISDMVRVIEEMDEDTHQLYPTAGTYCDWKCSHQPICLAQDDGSNYEAIVDLHYRQRETEDV